MEEYNKYSFIDCLLLNVTSSGKYFMYIQNENKVNNIQLRPSV